MRPFSRIMTTITAQFDELVSQIENHEAVAEASLRNLQEDIRNAKVQYKMVQKDLEQTQNKRNLNDKEILTWKGRAKKYAESDREKAIHCMERVQQHESEEELLNQRETDLIEASTHLNKQLLNVESQYQILRSKIQSMACRDHAANLKAQPIQSGLAAGEVDQVFRRWEKVITKKEVTGEMAFDDFGLGSEIEEQEKSQNLELALDELIKQS